jgi:DNA repair protein RecO (recombination protein O)
MHWLDDAIILSARKYGENSVILQVLTRDHGRSSGMVRGGTGKRLRGLLQPGNEVGVKWQGRLSEQLGNFTVEAKASHGTLLFDQPLSLAASSALLALLEKVLPEKEVHSSLFEVSKLVLMSLSEDVEHWGPLFVRWELGVLAELGYGLDLTECIATGSSEDLIYVSPKSGCAVSEGAGLPYRDKLLKLPEFLKNNNSSANNKVLLTDICAGFDLTGYFIRKNLMPHYSEEALPARERLRVKLATLADRS